MQNKWFVAGMTVPAIAAAIVAMRCMIAQNWLLAIVPALLAAGLARGAWWAWHTDPFGSVERRCGSDVGTDAAVARWNQHRAERDADAKVTAAKAEAAKTATSTAPKA